MATMAMSSALERSRRPLLSGRARWSALAGLSRDVVVGSQLRHCCRCCGRGPEGERQKQQQRKRKQRGPSTRRQSTIDDIEASPAECGRAVPVIVKQPRAVHEGSSEGDLCGKRGLAAARKAPGGAAILKFLFSSLCFFSSLHFFFPFDRSSAKGPLCRSSLPVFRVSPSSELSGSASTWPGAAAERERENHGSLVASTKTSTAAVAGRRRDLFHFFLFLCSSSSLRFPDPNSTPTPSSSSPPPPRNVLAFWLLGLANNSPYTIALAAANELAAGAVGSIFFTAVLPALLFKLTTPFWFPKVHVNVAGGRGGAHGPGGVPAACRGDKEDQGRRKRGGRGVSAEEQQQRRRPLPRCSPPSPCSPSRGARERPRRSPQRAATLTPAFSSGPGPRARARRAPSASPS